MDERDIFAKAFDGMRVSGLRWRSLCKQTNINRWTKICFRAIISFEETPWMNVHFNARLYVCMYVCLYVWMYVCMYVCMYVSMYVCMYVCMYACMYESYADFVETNATQHKLDFIHPAIHSYTHIHSYIHPYIQSFKVESA